VVWLRSDDFKKRVELFKQRNKGIASGSKKLPSQPPERSPAFAVERQIRPSNTANGRAADESHILQMTIPIWFREKKRQMFKESDPEWKSFLDLQEDKKRVSEIKMKISKAVAVQLQRPQHAVNLQYIRFNQRMGANLEVVPPIYAPEQYEVPNLWITSDWTVNFGWSTLSRAASAKTERMFHPVVFSQAFGAGVRSFSTTTFGITKAKILDQYYGPEPFQIRVSMVGKDKIVTAVTIQRELSREEQVITKLPINQIPEKEAKQHLPFLRGDPVPESVVKKHYRGVVSSMTYQDAMDHAIIVFKQTWLDKQIAAVQRSTNGVCTIRGFLDCMGERGRYRLEVLAYYLPAEDAFVGKPRITKHYIIPDLPRFKTAGPAEHNVVVRPQQGVQIAPDKAHPVHDPPPPTERPSPGKDAGK
jgi:hypothetical protein